jgi:catechol 2,3-dioxygenase-like lactoylglutathione lyase family enzyme
MTEGMGFVMAGEGARLGSRPLHTWDTLTPERVSYRTAGMKASATLKKSLHRLDVLAIIVGLICVHGLLEQTRAAESGRAKITGIAYVKVKVTDVEKAKAFYGGLLGLASGGVKDGNLVQASFVVNREQRVELTKGAAGTGGSYLVEIGLATDDLMKMRTYLTAKGVAANDIMPWPDGTKCFETQDPEGNKLVFVEQTKNGSSGSAGAVGKKMLHAGFVVKDLKAESHFYEDILGFRLYWRGGFKDDGTDWYEIQVPDGDNWIEFMLNIPVTADHKDLGVQNHFSLGVGKAKATAEELRARGAKEFDGPEVGRDGKDSIDIYDPDGTRVELMEFTPVEKPCCTEYTGAHPKP